MVSLLILIDFTHQHFALKCTLVIFTLLKQQKSIISECSLLFSREGTFQYRKMLKEDSFLFHMLMTQPEHITDSAN